MEYWAQATAAAFVLLKLGQCAEVVKPEWWNDEELKELSARVVRVAPNQGIANGMRAEVLSGLFNAWGVEARSAAELMEAATHFERAAALSSAPAQKASLTGNADLCRAAAWQNEKP